MRSAVPARTSMYPFVEGHAPTVDGKKKGAAGRDQGAFSTNTSSADKSSAMFSLRLE
jgi:hypothetical protein